MGSGVTGAEFASAYNGLGSKVTLISSRDRVLPGEDTDAAEVLEDVFERRGVKVLSRVPRRDRGAHRRRRRGHPRRRLARSTGSHCLVAVGSIPNTAGIGLEEAGVALTESGHIKVDGVSRTTAPNIYAAGDCTGVLALASVAAMQGRIAMAHFLGDARHAAQAAPGGLQHLHLARRSPPWASPRRRSTSGKYQGDVIKLSLRSNAARQDAQRTSDGFVKIFARKGSGTVIGGVVVGPNASELIFPISIAVTQKLHVDDVASTFTVYPSLSGSISEAARRLHVHL